MISPLPLTAAFPPVLSITEKQQMVDNLTLFMRKIEESSLQKRDIQRGVNLLKEVFSDTSFSIDHSREIYTLATALLQVGSKEQALLEHMKIAISLRTSTEPLDEKKMESVLSQFTQKENKQLLSKWKKEKLDIRAFLYNPLESRFVMKMHLDKASHYWSDEIRFSEEDKALSLRINGVFQSLTPFMRAFVIKKEPLIPMASVHRESLVEKTDSSKTWEYLPETGLTPYSSAQWETLPPFGHLSPEEVAYAQKKALLHAKGASEGQYIVEIVAHWRKPNNSFLLSGIQEINSGGHPWIRLIKPDGTWYSVGFNIGKKLAVLGQRTMGVLLAPDPEETIPHTARTVTGIRINEMQFQDLLSHIEETQKQKVDFQYAEQNCTRFIQSVVDCIDLEEKPFFHVRISEMAFRSLPKAVQKGLTAIKNGLKPFTDAIGQLIPPVIPRIFKLVTTTFQLIGDRLLLFILGKQLFYLNKKELKLRQKDPHAGIPWYHFLTHLQIAADNQLVKAFVPLKVLEWQMKAPGTRVYPGSLPFREQYHEAC